jgi:hypothetical protein
MLLKLPIIIDNKVVFTLFKLIKHDTFYLLSLLKNIDNDNINCNVLSDKICTTQLESTIIKIMLSNNIAGYNFYNIFVPLKLFIINNELISVYFFITYFCSLNNLNANFDFFLCLNNIIKCNNLQLVKEENYIKYQNNIFETINIEYLRLNNNKKYNKEFWEIINLLLSTSLFILWLNNYNIKILKKIQNGKRYKIRH